MAVINLKTRTIQIKIVYYGPALSGKSLSLKSIGKGGDKSRVLSQLVSLKTREDHSVFFDFLTLVLPRINGFDLHVRLYSVPGHDLYNETRKLILRGVDGVVFVADASAMRKSNILSLKNLGTNLREHKKDIARIPLVFQFNKYDLAANGALLLPPATLWSDLNRPLRRPCFVTSALRGRGVVAALKKIVVMTLDAVQKKYDEVR
jgi:hypothetical protein